MNSNALQQVQKNTAPQLFAAFLGLLLLTNSAVAQIPQIPQIPAFLPTIDQVPATQALPMDGTWLWIPTSTTL